MDLRIAPETVARLPFLQIGHSIMALLYIRSISISLRSANPAMLLPLSIPRSISHWVIRLHFLHLLGSRSIFSIWIAMIFYSAILFPPRLITSKEIIAAYPYLHQDTVIMIDDYTTPYGGKGKLVLGERFNRAWLGGPLLWLSDDSNFPSSSNIKFDSI